MEISKDMPIWCCFRLWSLMTTSSGPDLGVIIAQSGPMNYASNTILTRRQQEVSSIYLIATT
jgi:hypothetical protein